MNVDDMIEKEGEQRDREREKNLEGDVSVPCGVNEGGGRGVGREEGILNRE